MEISRNVQFLSSSAVEIHACRERRSSAAWGIRVTKFRHRNVGCQKPASSENESTRSSRLSRELQLHSCASGNAGSWFSEAVFAPVELKLGKMEIESRGFAASFCFRDSKNPRALTSRCRLVARDKINGGPSTRKEHTAGNQRRREREREREQQGEGKVGVFFFFFFFGNRRTGNEVWTMRALRLKLIGTWHQSALDSPHEFLSLSLSLSLSRPIEKPLSDRMLCFKVDQFIVEAHGPASASTNGDAFPSMSFPLPSLFSLLFTTSSLVFRFTGC